MTLASTANLNATTPAPASGRANIVFADDAGTPTVNISAIDPVMVGDSGSGGVAGNAPAPGSGDAAAGKFLKADATWEVPPGGGLDQLTGDVTAGPGSGSLAATLATVNSDVGSFTSANITVNAKGLVTAAANGSGGGGGGGTFEDEIVTFSGTSGTLSHTPTTLYGLYKNGLRLTSLGGSPDFSISSATVTLTVAETSGDVYEATYLY